MRISWNWLSELVDLSKVGGPNALGDLLTQRGLEVEAVERMDQGLEKVITAQILERNPHPNSDRLSLCKVSLGSGEPLEIVCGAQNMKAGDRVALAQVGAQLPNGLKIEKSKIRGVESAGMLCSEEELKFRDKSEGILILPAATPLGQPLAKALGRDDSVLVFKLTANRGDCMSHFGMAREIAAALGQKARKPVAKELPRGGCPIAIHLDAGELSPQFHGAYLEGVKIGPSPAWVVKRLEAVGSRSINNVVDATNLLMLELGHPVHAYDADRIAGKQIRVRMGKAGESLPLLDGANVTLAGTELVIADGERAVGLAGVMGGGNSEVQDSTTRVFLECAEFNSGLVRKAASRHQRRTDAAQRFEKGVDPAGLSHAIARLSALVVELAGGRIVGSAAELHETRVNYRSAKIAVSPSYFVNFLGMDLTAAQSRDVLAGLDCDVVAHGEKWEVTPPTYRRDLSSKEDLAEEVARSVGYDRIRETVPALTSSPTSVHAEASASTRRRALIDKAKDSLAAVGLSEALNFSFTSKDWLAKFGMESGLKIINPLSEEHEYMVPSLIPGLVQNALHNWHHHFGSETIPVRLFEIRPTFHAASAVSANGEMEVDGNQEIWKLAFCMSGPAGAGGLRNEQREVDFFDVKAVVESLLQSLGSRGVRFQPLSASRSGGNPLFHPGQSVEVLAGKDVAGCFGLMHPAKVKELKLRAPLWLCELNWEMLARLSPAAMAARTFKPWSEFPPMERDFALLVKSDITADRITQLALKAGKPLAKVAKIFDVYRGSQVAQGMTSVAVRVIFYEDTRSLQEAEAEAASNQILEAWKKELGAELRG